jgi:hypothetical protein
MVTRAPRRRLPFDASEVKVTRLLSRRMGFPVALVLGVNVTRARISSGLGIPPLSSSRSPLRRSS